MKIKVCQKQLYTSGIVWPHLWAAFMCLPNSSCLLSSRPCVSGDWTASGTLHAILYLTFTPPPNTSLMVTDQGDAICPDQSIPWPYKSLSKWQTIWNRAYILRQCQGQGQKWYAYRCTRGSAASWLISSSYSTSYYNSKITFLTTFLLLLFYDDKYCWWWWSDNKNFDEIFFFKLMTSLISLIFHWGNSFKVIFFILFWFSKFIMKVKLTLCKPFINVKHTEITVSFWQVCKPNINDFFLHENTCLFDNKSEFRLQLFPHG